MGNSTRLQELLDLLQAGDDSARTGLIQHSMDRCRQLASRMFHPNRDLRKLDETDDILQKAMMRLYRALAEVKPPNVRAFLGLAAQQIRWVLADLVRDAADTKRVVYTGTVPEQGRVEEPRDLAEWSEFHQRIDGLPPEEKELFDLLLYQGLSQPEAAAVLNISLRTVKRRWQRARLTLRDALKGEWPSLEER